MIKNFNPSDPSKLPSYRYAGPIRSFDELPDSTPLGPNTFQTTITPSSIEEMEIAAAHHALDALGVPAVADIDVTMEDEAETRFTTHDLRLHGRIRFLAQRLGELGIPPLFGEHRDEQDTPSPE